METRVLVRGLVPLAAGTTTVLLVASLNSPLMSRAVAFYGRAFLLLVGICAVASVWWCISQDCLSMRRGVARYAIASALATYIGCVVGCVIGAVLALVQVIPGHAA